MIMKQASLLFVVLFSQNVLGDLDCVDFGDWEETVLSCNTTDMVGPTVGVCVNVTEDTHCPSTSCGDDNLNCYYVDFGNNNSYACCGYQYCQNDGVDGAQTFDVAWTRECITEAPAVMPSVAPSTAPTLAPSLPSLQPTAAPATLQVTEESEDSPNTQNTEDTEDTEEQPSESFESTRTQNAVTDSADEDEEDTVPKGAGTESLDSLQSLFESNLELLVLVGAACCVCCCCACVMYVRCRRKRRLEAKAKKNMDNMAKSAAEEDATQKPKIVRYSSSVNDQAIDAALETVEAQRGDNTDPADESEDLSISQHLEADLKDIMQSCDL